MKISQGETIPQQPPISNSFASQLIKSIVVSLVGFFISFIVKEAFIWFYNNPGIGFPLTGPRVYENGKFLFLKAEIELA